jgi:hypothetical protein
MLVAGFYRPSNALPVWFGWLQYLSFSKYLYDVRTQFFEIRPYTFGMVMVAEHISHFFC